MVNKMIYKPIELHSHTIHSDGSMNTEELLKNAKNFGYSGIFITDHNTNSGFSEIIEKGSNKIIPVFSGVEWTSFYGHMLILGANDIGDWTEASVDNIEECIEKVRKKEDVAVGIAHPFVIGNPICTGCHWDFNVKDWNKFDYLELANSGNPQDFFWNEKAYKFWRNLINKGYKIAAASGRDWHVMEENDKNYAVTMIGIEGDFNTKNIISAIRNCRTYLTLGPIMDISITGSKIIRFGDIIKSEKLDFSVVLKKCDFKNYDKFDINPFKILLYNNNDVVFKKAINYEENIKFSFIPEKGNIRFEIIGEIKGKSNVRLVITSPIFVE